MKPLMLHGHERSITDIKYNREGDLLFSSAKDQNPTVWYSLNGERLGTYKGHGGAVWCIDVDWETQRLISGSADNTVRLWDVETGKQESMLDSRSAVRACKFSFCGQKVFYTTDKAMGHNCEIHFIDIRDPEKPYMTIPVDSSKVTSAIWGPLDQFIVTGHENGELTQWDTQTGKKLLSVKEHSKLINDIQPSKDGSMFVTGSKDSSSKLFDTDTLRHLKTYRTERPVNSAAISPVKDHIVLGGGQDAMEVTLTSGKMGKFESRFFHMVFEEELGRVKGHFGPINRVTFHPDGGSYSSGGEDGYIRVHQFDQSYFDFEFEY